MNTNTTRFSDRVDDYVKYRPGYPQQIIQILKEKIGLNNNSAIADIGSGTGISTKLFLNNGNKIYAVEPNKEMREAAESSFSHDKNYTSVIGTAEETNLQDASVEIIFSAQAFHWFDQPKAKIEFNRILEPNGHIVLVWNVRSTKNEFHKEYDKILQAIPAYNDAAHRNISDKEIIDFFSPQTMHKECVNNFQKVSLDALKGRLRSSSYFPKTGIEYEKIIHAVEVLFSKYQKDGLIEFQYETNIYWY